MRLTTGSQLGAYEIKGFIGAGGMGEVYRARDGRLNRDVALKIVRTELSTDPEQLVRLQQEARLAAALSHANIVAVYDVGVHDGIFYVVSELLEGETLRERLAAARVPLSTALDWAVQLARGLGAAHELGVVHRDLKPENVFISRNGTLKLLDFGIAKCFLKPPASGGRSLLDPTLAPDGGMTATGSILGTPGYMSPEQVRGEPVDIKSDVFSLGSILYELLSGQRAFPGESLFESGYAVLHRDPPPLPATVPEPIAHLVRKCLEKDPKQRLHSVQDLAIMLDGFRVDSLWPGSRVVGKAGGPPVRRRRWLWFATAAGIAVGLLGSGLIVARRHPAARPRDATPTVRQLTFDRASIFAARFSPDGQSVLVSRSASAGPPEISSINLRRPRIRPIGVGDAQLLSVSRSGELAVAVHPTFAWFDAGRGTLARAPSVGGSPREIALDVEYADWAPDGEHMAVARYSRERSRLEFPVGTVVYESSGFISHPRVSPSGDRVAFIDHPLSLDSAGEVLVVDRKGQVERWGPHFTDALGLAWWPDGREVLLTASEAGEPAGLHSVRPDGARVLYRGTGELLLDDVAPDGRVLLTERVWRQEVEMARNSAESAPVQHLDWAALIGVSDDGRAILWGESGVGVGGKAEVLLRRAGEAAPIELGPGRPMALSPDGRQVLVWREGRPGALWLIPTGPGDPRQVTVPGVVQIDSAGFFADGHRYALVGREDPVSPNRLYLFDARNRTVKPLSPPGLPRFALNAAVSPDQRWVSALDPEGVLTAYRVDGGEPVRATSWGPGLLPAGWLANGMLLAFERFRVPSEVKSLDLATGRTAPFRTFEPRDIDGVKRVVRV
ncbi:MAG TPA: protein kinase, partial [Myxococcaceae bacterium]|nr:protein kinase [Myxococcaceae bacterium]